MNSIASKPLIVFEMANNHMGSLEHGLQILRHFGAVVEPFRGHFDFAFKLQYRDLDTFIHPDFQQRMDIKYIKRFQETRLTEAQFIALKDEMLATGFLPVCTPFDEPSVNLVEAHGFRYIKIASCSLGDWPLMERIARSSLPVIASTAGASLEVLDQVVSFFDHRKHALTLLHCIGEYPTPAAHLQLNQIDFLKARYPQHVIGFSTHESPDNVRYVQMAVAKGARVFEKHVGLAIEDIPLNAYSASPEQVASWLQAATEALEACGSNGGRYEPSKAEAESLQALRRGVYVVSPVAAGDYLDPANLLLAMPTEPGQLTANDLSKYAEFRVHEAIEAKSPVFASNLERTDHRDKVLQIVQRVRALLQDGHAVVSEKADVDISHHYGIERFDEIGTTIINVVNRAYCKKLIVMLPGQRHPEQFHKQKEETFHILHGSLTVSLDDAEITAGPGEVITVERGVRHAFWSEGGAIIEEISSTHFTDDSFYTDPAIQQNAHRKTQLTYFFG
jgi:sialic acid synthase SpsE/quercetin dioxygenase-like cupin family protein